ncbi:Serine-threonine rich protein [Pleurostoma richardsiae]|uniref:Serine-threonine rich protein n=1 Tax=Pleurostoma richardsiae TaxID=41990 RepID=A0AA38VDD5_9PEZI|nr:Serine-threonine rich protein [Pleurostoma richardsiae]
MKFSAALAMAVAPLALAKSVRNSYPVRRDPVNVARSPSPNAKAKAGISELSLQGLSGFGITETQLSEVIVIWVNPGSGAATTTINQQQTVTQTVTVTNAAEAGTTTLASSASTTVGATGATHSVIVGGAAGLVYTPNEIQAVPGDMVIFTFMSANHTATQSAFDTPCEALAGGMDSGFQPNANNSVNPPPQVAMQVMVDTPLWFYCKQKGHCGKGMTFSINPTAAKTQAMFQAMAIAQNGTGTGSAITGNGTAAAPAEGSSSVATTATSLLPLGTESAAASTATSSVVTGTGTTNADGSCACAVVCAVGSFPAVQAQGIGAFGGFSGALPASMVAA